MSKEIIPRERKSLSMKQKRFLVEYRDCISVKEAARRVGITVQHAKQWMSRPYTLFGKMYAEISNQIVKDERFSKVAGLERLYRYLEMAEADGEYMNAVKIQGEINKMIEGNIAIQKSVEKKETEVTVKVIDFTQRIQLPANNVIDITAEEV